MFVFITCSEGAAALTISLNYAGGAMPTVTQLMLPDYGIGGAMANDPVFFNLIEGMDKWSTSDQEGDGPSHTITGIELNPSMTDLLTSIQVTKTNGSHAVFWGATGIATSAVNTGAGGAGGTSGGAGASGSAGTGGTSAGTSSGGNAGNASVGASGSANSGGTSSVAGAPTAQAGASAISDAGSSSSASGDETSSNGGCAFTTLAPRRQQWLGCLSLFAFAAVARRRSATRRGGSFSSRRRSN
jgi:hypothetical protein